MTQERLHTDEQLKQIELNQIAIDAEKWPRKDVEAFFERWGVEPSEYEGGRDGRFISRSGVNSYSDFTHLSVVSKEKELTLPDALRWEELHEKSTFDKALVSELREENSRLKAELKRLKSKPEIDNRVKFDKDLFDSERKRVATVHYSIHGDPDNWKVLVAQKGYRWQLQEDYSQDKNAVSLIKINDK